MAGFPHREHKKFPASYVTRSRESAEVAKVTCKLSKAKPLCLILFGFYKLSGRWIALVLFASFKLVFFLTGRKHLY